MFLSDKPHVVLESSGKSVFNEGETLSLSCILLKSYPAPWAYTWYKNQKLVSDAPFKQNYVKKLEPDDGGSYTCGATNDIGTGTSIPVQITVQCKSSVIFVYYKAYVPPLLWL